MKFSIVIPAHNEEQNIGNCVAELQRVVRNENHVPYEMIVVNDDSNNGEAVIAELMAVNTNVARWTAHRRAASAAPSGQGWRWLQPTSS